MRTLTEVDVADQPQDTGLVAHLITHPVIPSPLSRASGQGRFRLPARALQRKDFSPSSGLPYDVRCHPVLPTGEMFSRRKTKSQTVCRAPLFPTTKLRAGHYWKTLCAWTRADCCCSGENESFSTFCLEPDHQGLCAPCISSRVTEQRVCLQFMRRFRRPSWKV